jgi:7,8-dihydropterin-6-yl-methyl-4-(beta-D-ribofuranosyl)aminobenzene 5'-phosphate synthase
MALMDFEDITTTIVYDNHEYDPQLRSDWGFSCLIELQETTLLFDTGGDGDILLQNMRHLRLDPLKVDHVFLSHIHGDHTGGLRSILGMGGSPVVWIPSSFPAAFEQPLRSWTDVRDVAGPNTMFPGVYSTGELGIEIVEQSLILETRQGLVVITGCAHPGIVSVLTKTKELHAGDLFLVMGGFHLRGKGRTDLQRIFAEMRSLGVQRVAPCHCTGDEAIAMFSDEWGDEFLGSGVGTVIGISGPAAIA